MGGNHCQEDREGAREGSNAVRESEPEYTPQTLALLGPLRLGQRDGQFISKEHRHTEYDDETTDAQCDEGDPVDDRSETGRDHQPK